MATKAWDVIQQLDQLPFTGQRQRRYRCSGARRNRWWGNLSCWQRRHWLSRSPTIYSQTRILRAICLVI